MHRYYSLVVALLLPLASGSALAQTSTLASVNGSVEAAAGASSVSGLQGLTLVVGSYAQSGTVTQWYLQCFVPSAAKTVTNCAANPSSIAGVALSTSGTAQVAESPSEVPISATMMPTVMIGHTVCAGSAPGQVTDSGGTGQCGSSITVGVVVAISGAWPGFPDGTTFPPLGATLPLVRLTTDGTTKAGVVDTLTVGSGSSTAGQIIWYDGSGLGVTQSAPTGWMGEMSGYVLECQEGPAANACTWAWVDPNALSSPSLGPAPSPITETFTAGASSLTQYTLVALDSSGNAIPVTGPPAYGVAQAGTTSGQMGEVARYGTTKCVADNTTVVGHLATIGTTTAMYCKDTQVTSAGVLSSSTQIVGIFRSGTSAGSQALVELTPGQFGTANGLTAITCTSSGCTGTNVPGTLTGSMYTLGVGDSGRTVIMNCTAACTVQLPVPLPPAFSAVIESINTNTATVDLNGHTFNTGTAPILLQYVGLPIYSNGSNWYGSAPLAAGTSISLTPATNSLTIGLSGATGQIPNGSAGAFTATPTLGVNGSTTGTLGLATSTASGVTTTLQPSAVTSAVTATLPSNTGTLVGSGDTGTVTNTMLAGSIANSKLLNSSTTVNGQTCTLGSPCNVETATSGQLAVSGGSGAALTGAAQFTYSSGTLTGGSSAVLDLSGAAATGLKVPVVAGAAPTTQGQMAYDSTKNGLLSQKCN